jgi:hypothetical protein
LDGEVIMNARAMLVLWFASLLSTACTSEKPDEAPCPADVAAGQSLACSCPDDGTLMGTTLCTEEMTLTACDCSNAVPVGSSPASAAGSGAPRAGAPALPEGGSAAPPPSTTEPPLGPGTGAGAPVAGSAGGGGTGAGGEGGEPNDLAGAGGAGNPSDAGPEDDDVPGGSDAGPLPTDGKQLAVCESGSDCDQGYECFTDAPGPSFCSKSCESDDECADIEGGEYTCFEPGSVCRIVCEDAEDDGACPHGQTCRFLNPLAGFRCAYPD